MVCFDCRKMFKRRLLLDIHRDTGFHAKESETPAVCPECGKLTADMGLDFKPPRKSDVKAWKHLADLYTAGITFHSCGCSGPGYIPKDKQALLKHLKEVRETYIAHRRFWSIRVEPESEPEKQRDALKNNQFIYSIPSSLKSGTKKNLKTDIERAIKYWNEALLQLDENLKQLVATKN